MQGLTRTEGRLRLDGIALDELAARYGTPLHVASAATLRARCREFAAALRGYPGRTRIHFSYKTNPVAGLLRILHGEGIGAEVVNGYELWLAHRLGVPGEGIVFNGSNKADGELRAALAEQVGLVVVDGLAELDRLAAIAEQAGRRAPVALRICPDVVPAGMNASSATGSRRSQFGLDLRSGEAGEAIHRCVGSRWLRLRGIHCHVGSGIRDLRAFERAAGRAVEVQAQAIGVGATPDLIDVGGGLGTRASREFTALEMLHYLFSGHLPRAPRPAPEDLVQRYGSTLSRALVAACHRHRIPLPDLVLEPGRALSSDAQILLLTVGDVRQRPGVGRFALADGGAMTVSLMFLSEHHPVLLANRDAPAEGRTSVFGRLPSPMDVVYRSLPLPRLQVGDVLAVLDAGAYFTSTATNFGGPRPAVLLVEDGGVRVVRRRETFEDLSRVELDLDEAAAGSAP